MGRLGGVGRRSSASFSSTTAASAGGGSNLAGVGSGYGDADVAKLKDAIQTLCQSTHPLGEYIRHALVFVLVS